MTIDIDKAKQLRLEGFTHQEIANTLGCSLGWCKANLKGIKQPNKDIHIVEKVQQLGRSANGVTTGEIRQLVLEEYNIEGKALADKINEIKRVARRNNKDVVIRPYWMLPEQARDCTTAMLEYANEIWQFKQHLADKYRQAYNLDISYNNAIVYALTAMSAGENNQLLPQGLLEYGNQLGLVQDALAERNEPTTGGELVSLEELNVV